MAQSNEFICILPTIKNYNVYFNWKSSGVVSLQTLEALSRDRGNSYIFTINQ